jgi:hypothetical protein
VAVLKARESVRTLKEYHPPLGNREGLRLDFNENTAGCSPRVLERVRQIDGEAMARYPVRDQGERAVAKHFGISADEVLLTNGTDEAIHLVCETYLEPEDEAIIVVPTFAMFEIYAAQTGAKVISIPAGEDFGFPTEQVIAAVTSHTRFIAAANPNNPTGTFVPIRDLVRIAEDCRAEVARKSESVYLPHILEGLWYGRPSHGCADGRQRANENAAPGEFAIQSELGGAGVLARRARRPAIRQQLCGTVPGGAGRVRVSTRRVEGKVLAEPGELCAHLSRGKLQAFHSANARARNLGARPLRRLRLQKLRTNHDRNPGA